MMTQPIIAALLPAVPADASERLITQWLHGRPPHTQRAYRREAARFRAFVGPDIALDRVTLADLQSYADHLAEQPLSAASRARALAAVKALLAFGHRLGVLPVNAGAALRLPPVRRGLAARILPEADVQRLLALTSTSRDHALLRLLYASGLRVGELVALRWRDLLPHGESGVISVWGKGAKERTVLLPGTIWRELQGLRGEAEDAAPLFRSRKGKPLSDRQVERVVRAAAVRAGITLPASPHWLRHAHASHALDRGAPLPLVRDTLGHASVATTGQYLHARPGESSGTYLAI
jgi:integrase/recombinase XerD